MMSSSEKFCLKWNEFELNISQGLKEIREEKDFLDVTLVCDDDNQIDAHKVILSACSPFFRNILRRNSHQHPLLYLKGVKYRELLAVLNFMYVGEVSVAQEELNVFLSVAEELRVKGLTQNKKVSAEPPDKTKQLGRGPESAPATTSGPAMKRPKTTASTRSVPPPEIEELFPVKTEPREILQTTVQQRQPPGQAQALYHPQTYQEQDGVQEDIDTGNKGMIALNDTYAVDEGYDYSYAEEHHFEQEHNANILGESTGKGGAKSMNMSENLEPGTKKLSRVPIKSFGVGQKAWQCELCDKISSSRKRALEHLEDDHQ